MGPLGIIEFSGERGKWVNIFLSQVTELVAELSREPKSLI